MIYHHLLNTTRRYYLSKSWAGNLRRYVEAQARRRRHSPSSVGSSSTGKGRRRGRERAESNLMPPWEDMNADIVCQHGGLAHTSQTSRGKVGWFWRPTWIYAYHVLLICGVRELHYNFTVFGGVSDGFFHKRDSDVVCWRVSVL